MAPGSQPNNDADTASTPGDFKRVPSSWCNGDVHTSAFDGVLADVDVQQLRALFPASAGNFDGREPGVGAQTSNGRPNTEPYGFTVKVLAQLDGSAVDLQGEDRRNMYLHRDQDMLPGFPRDLGGAHGTASPRRSSSTSTATTATSWSWAAATASSTPIARTAPSCRAGRCAATRRRCTRAGAPSSQAPCRTTSVARSWRRWPQRTSTATARPRWSAPTSRARSTCGTTAATCCSGAVPTSTSPASRCSRSRTCATCAQPRREQAPPHPARLRRLARAGRPRHDDGGRSRSWPRRWTATSTRGTTTARPCPGSRCWSWTPARSPPSIPRRTPSRFNSNAGEALNQGAIIDTPAVGDLTGDGRPEIVVGTNEEYAANQGNEGPLNAATFNATTIALLAQAGGIPIPETPPWPREDQRARVRDPPRG